MRQASMLTRAGLLSHVCLCHYYWQGGGSANVTPIFAPLFSATRDIDLHPPSGGLSHSVSSANQTTTNPAKCAMGSTATIVWGMSIAFGDFSVRPDLPGTFICHYVKGTFKGPDLKRSAYTRSAWLAAACAAS